ncbi:MAG: hypothetical protein ABI183_15990 [Polyangiaceae bacterium]
MALCEHLSALENELIDRGIRITSRGAPWSENCREWVYFACVLDQASLRKRFKFAPCVIDHENTDPRSGVERGLVCEKHFDAIMGVLKPSKKEPRIG